LRCVHERLTKAKGSGQRQAGSAFVFAIDAMPFAVTGWALRGLTRLRQRGVVTVATNVPGPRKQLTVMGRNVVRMLPIPPIALQLRTAIAIFSYVDQLVFGVTADYDTVPDIDVFAADIVETIEQLVSVSGRRRAQTNRPGLRGGSDADHPRAPRVIQRRLSVCDSRRMAREGGTSVPAGGFDQMLKWPYGTQRVSDTANRRSSSPMPGATEV